MSRPSFRWGTAAVLLLGVCLIVLGLWRGELAVYFAKSTNLCLECVGIG